MRIKEKARQLPNPWMGTIYVCEQTLKAIEAYRKNPTEANLCALAPLINITEDAIKRMNPKNLQKRISNEEELAKDNIKKRSRR